MRIEELGYFLRYLPPAGVGLAAVVGLAYLTKWLPSVFGSPEYADPLELFAFSILVSGPFVFAAAFVASFFGLAWIGGDNDWAKQPLAIALTVLAVVLVAHFVFLPRR